jgi:hypothetical protein
MAASTSEAGDDALPISGLQHLAFCPRQWALIHLEQAWAENVRTAEGRLLHERADLPGESRRASVRTVRGMWLRSERLRLTGRADIVEFGPVPYPVEYNGARASRTTATRYSSVRRRFVWKRCCRPRLDEVPSSTATRDGGWRLNSHHSYAPERKNSRPPCTAYTEAESHPLRLLGLTAATAHWSMCVFPRPLLMMTTPRGG